MNIRWQVLSRTEITRDEVLKKPVSDREDAIRAIREHQAIFPITGYNAEHDYWWARRDDGDFVLHRWFIE